VPDTDAALPTLFPVLGRLRGCQAGSKFAEDFTSVTRGERDKKAHPKTEYSAQGHDIQDLIS